MSLPCVAIEKISKRQGQNAELFYVCHVQIQNGI